MLNNKRVLGSIAAIAAVLVIVIFGMMYYPAAFRVPYSAILTTTGEFYVGYIFHWPFSSTLRLSDVYVLHNVKDAKTNETRPQLTPMALPPPNRRRRPTKESSLNKKHHRLNAH